MHDASNAEVQILDDGMYMQHNMSDLEYRYMGMWVAALTMSHQHDAYANGQKQTLTKKRQMVLPETFCNINIHRI